MRSIPEVARQLGIPKASIARWIDRGWIMPSVRASNGSGQTLLDEQAMAQARACAALTAVLGDGAATDPVIREAVKTEALDLDTPALTVSLEVPLS